MRSITSHCRRVIVLVGMIILLLSVDAYSQRWTWVNGDSTWNTYPVWGTQGVPSQTNNPGARSYGVGWPDRQGNIWIFGGERYNNSYKLYFNDLWKYNPTSNLWTWMKGSDTFWLNGVAGYYGVQGVSSPTATPSARYQPMHWTDTAGNFWLYGGYVTALGYFSDLWKYDLLTNRWTWIKGDTVTNQSPVYGTFGVPSPANNPGVRSGNQNWADNSNNLWLYGGGGSGFDLWKYDISSGMWTCLSDNPSGSRSNFGTQGVPSPSNTPGYRSGATFWNDNSRNLWLFGGEVFQFISPHTRNDLWKFDLSTRLWTWVTGDSTFDHLEGLYGTMSIGTAFTHPGSRKEATPWTDNNGNLWLFGGDNHNDLWKYDINTNIWTWIRGDSSYLHSSAGHYSTIYPASLLNEPSSRGASTYIKDNVGNNWIFAGRENYPKNYGTAIDHNDLWMFSMQSITPVHLIAFNASLQGKVSQLHWTADNEISFDRYEIERSANGREFNKIGAVKASNAGAYSFDDNTPLFFNYYRLKMVDKDGKYEYSKIVMVSLPSSANGFTIYPNPATNFIQIQFGKAVTGKVDVEITDMNGKVVMKKAVNAEGETISLSNKLSTGTYMVSAICNQEKNVQKLVISR